MVMIRSHEMVTASVQMAVDCLVKRSRGRRERVEILDSVDVTTIAYSRPHRRKEERRGSLWTTSGCFLQFAGIFLFHGGMDVLHRLSLV